MGIPIRWWSAGRNADLVFDRTFDGVYDFALRAVRDPNRAADVVHETMARIRRDLRARRLPQDVKAYAFSIAAPIVVNELKDLLHVAPFAACLTEKQPVARWGDVVGVRKQGEDRVQRERAAAATWLELSELKPEDYCFTELHVRHELSTKWIAATLKRPHDEVRARVKTVTDRVDRGVRARLVVEKGCEDLRARLETSGASGDARVALIEEHASSCEHCAPHAARAAGAMGIARDFALIPASNCVKQEIRNSIDRQIEALDRAEPGFRLMRRPLATVLTILAAAGLVGGGTVAVVSTDSDAAPPVSHASSSPAPTASPSPAPSTPRSGSPRPSIAPALPGRPALEARLDLPSTVALAWTTPAANGSPVTSFVVQRAIGGGVFEQIARTSLTTFADTVARGRTYLYRVAAFSEVGRGRFSDQVSVVVPEAPDPIVPPSAPRNLTIELTNCNATLNWDAPKSPGSSPVTGYIVSRVDEDGNVTRLTPDPITATTYNDAPSPENQTWIYRVAAVNEAAGKGDLAVAAPVFVECIPG